MIQSVPIEDDGFPDNLAPPKQKMVKRGVNISYIWLEHKGFTKLFSGKIRVNSAKGRSKRWLQITHKKNTTEK